MLRLRLVTALVFASLAAPLMASDYDVVILNGRVMDPETNFDAVRNVGVKDGRRLHNGCDCNHVALRFDTSHFKQRGSGQKRYD